MKYLLLLVITVFGNHIAYSQDSIASNPDPALTEKMIQLAMQDKTIEVANHQIQIAKYNLKQSKRWWLEEISLSFNANEFTIKRFENKSDNTIDSRYSYYPLYNFGLNIPIGKVFTKSMSVKTAREEVKITEALRDNQTIIIRSKVLSAYQDYVQNKKLYTLQLKSTEDAFNEFLQSKEKFKNDQISLKDYNSASTQYDNAIKNKVLAEHDYQLAKITLEQLIGMPIEELLSSYN